MCDLEHFQLSLPFSDVFRGIPAGHGIPPFESQNILLLLILFIESASFIIKIDRKCRKKYVI